MTGYTTTNRGRFKCSFCNHASYKIYGALISHLNTKHETQFKLAQKDAEIERLKNMPPKVGIREKVVYRDPPAKKEPQYWYGVVGIYCSSCRKVISNPGIPVRQTIENTPCSKCYNRTLMLVEEIK